MTFKSLQLAGRQLDTASAVIYFVDIMVVLNLWVSALRCPSLQARIKTKPLTRPSQLLPRNPVATRLPAMASRIQKRNLKKKNPTRSSNAMSHSASRATTLDGLNTKSRKSGPPGKMPLLKGRISTIRFWFCSTWSNSWPPGHKPQKTDIYLWKLHSKEYDSKRSEEHIHCYQCSMFGRCQCMARCTFCTGKDYIRLEFHGTHDETRSRHEKIKEAQLPANHSYPWCCDRCSQSICDKVTLQFGKCESRKAYTTESPQIRSVARAQKQKRAHNLGNCCQWNDAWKYCSADWVVWFIVARTSFAAAQRSSGWILSQSAHNMWWQHCALNAVRGMETEWRNQMKGDASFVSAAQMLIWFAPDSTRWVV